MRQYQLRGKRFYEIDSERVMLLEYSMIQEDSDTGEVIFGAAIRKIQGETVETEEISGISEDRQFVLTLIDLMLEHVVTPVSMVYVVDDYITEKCCS